MRARLEAAGMATGSDASQADVLVVNTCTVTGRADQEARQLLRRLAREHPSARLIATGCYAQRAPEEIRAIPGVNLVLGVHERERVAEHVRAATQGVAVGSARERHALAPAAPLSFGRTRALLKVQDGCDAFCSYCVVPYVRGRDRSLPIAGAVAQARRLVDAGFQEIVITGADLGSYGRGGSGPGLLPELIRSVLALGPSHRVRLSSIEPNKLDTEIVSMLGEEPRLCRHLHLPLQSGSDVVLQAMRRPYRAAEYAGLLERIAARGPVAVGADVIVGFPAEGEREFEKTLAFLRALPLATLHVFRYSPRPGTIAARDPASASASAIRERARRVRELGEAKRIEFLRSRVGSRVSILAEAGRAGSAIVARSDFGEPVLVRGTDAWSGFRDAWIREVEGGRWAGSLVPLERAREPVCSGLDEGATVDPFPGAQYSGAGPTDAPRAP